MTNQEYLKAYLDITKEIEYDFRENFEGEPTRLDLYFDSIADLGLDEDEYFLDCIQSFIDELNSELVK